MTPAEAARRRVREYLSDLRISLDVQAWAKEEGDAEQKLAAGWWVGAIRAYLQREWKEYRRVMSGRPVLRLHHFDPPDPQEFKRTWLKFR